jgi:hypothetical protein
MPRAVARFEAGCSMSHLHSGFLLKLRKYDRKLRQHRLRERGRGGGRAGVHARLLACAPAWAHACLVITSRLRLERMRLCCQR